MHQLAIACVWLTISTLFVIAPAHGADWSDQQSAWHGFDRYDFQVDGRNCYVVVPPHPAPGNPWVWRARFPNYHPEADLILLERGFHVIPEFDVAGD